MKCLRKYDIRPYDFYLKFLYIHIYIYIRMTFVLTKMFLLSVPGESLSNALILEFNLAGSGKCFECNFRMKVYIHTR